VRQSVSQITSIIPSTWCIIAMAWKTCYKLMSNNLSPLCAFNNIYSPRNNVVTVPLKSIRPYFSHMTCPGRLGANAENILRQDYLCAFRFLSNGIPEGSFGQTLAPAVVSSTGLNLAILKRPQGKYRFRILPTNCFPVLWTICVTHKIFTITRPINKVRT